MCLQFVEETNNEALTYRNRNGSYFIKKKIFYIPSVNEDRLLFGKVTIKINIFDVFECIDTIEEYLSSANTKEELTDLFKLIPAIFMI